MPLFLSSLNEFSKLVDELDAPIVIVYAAGDLEEMMNIASTIVECNPIAIAILGPMAEQLRDFFEEEIFFCETSGDAEFVPDPHISTHISREELHHYLDRVLQPKFPYSEVVFYNYSID